jgi:hypothetical protein
MPQDFQAPEIDMAIVQEIGWKRRRPTKWHLPPTAGAGSWQGGPEVG